MNDYNQTLRILRVYFLLEGRLNKLDGIKELYGLTGTVEDGIKYGQLVNERWLDKILTQNTAKLRRSYNSRIGSVSLELREAIPFKGLIRKIELILK